MSMALRKESFNLHYDVVVEFTVRVYVRTEHSWQTSHNVSPDNEAVVAETVKDPEKSVKFLDDLF